MKKIKKEHRKKTRKTLKKLLKVRLRIKFFKNEFEKEKVKFLEHIIRKGDIKSDPKKIRILRKWSRSIRKKEVQELINFVNYYRKLTLKLSEMTYSLNQLLKKGKK